MVISLQDTAYSGPTTVHYLLSLRIVKMTIVVLVWLWLHLDRAKTRESSEKRSVLQKSDDWFDLCLDDKQ